MTKECVEFSSGIATDQKTDSTLPIKALTTPLSEMVNKPKELVIDEDVIDCDPRALARLVRALRQTEQIQTRGKVVDCMGFTSLMAGGTYNGLPQLGAQQVSVELAYGAPVPVEKLEIAPPLKPFLLGKPLSPDRIQPVHAHVKLLADHDLWVERLGVNNIVALAALSDVAEFYRSQQTAQLFSMEATYNGQNEMSYVELDMSIPTTVRIIGTET